MNDINANAEAYINQLDTYIDVMKEETAKLSSMIEKLNDKIKEAESEKEQLIKEQNEPKFEIAQDEKYYFVDFNSRGCNSAITSDVYVGALGDKLRVEQNNCFKTKERAREVLDKIELLLKLERLHDIYCPNYKPNWNDKTEGKWCVYRSCNDAKKWVYGRFSLMPVPTQSCFPTKEMAEKVCGALNKEEQSNEIS